ncbi:hypothetical protein QE410_003104 [Microbacterium sp. SORGH_AS 1204]|nr:hypothetical protein [Microbacterium sp. SORGH_AS_1204]
MLRAVPLQRGVDLVGQPQQREFAQRREVAETEVVRQRRVDPLRRVHRAGREPVAQRLRRQIDDLDLVGGAHHGIRDRLALHDPRDLLDHVVEGGDVLHVHGRDHVDTRGEQLVDVLPALVVARARRVGVRELVDERDSRMPLEHGIQIHLVECDTAVRHGAAGDGLEPLGLGGGGGAAVRLDDGDDHVVPFVAEAAPFLEHLVRLAHTGCRAEQHAEASALHASAPALVRREVPEPVEGTGAERVPVASTGSATWPAGSATWPVSSINWLPGSVAASGTRRRRRRTEGATAARGDTGMSAILVAHSVSSARLSSNTLTRGSPR